MPRTRRTFYADEPVSAHLDGIPDKLRSAWINQACLAALEAESSKATCSELARLRDWLISLQPMNTPFETDMLKLLNDFPACQPKKKE